MRTGVVIFRIPDFRVVIKGRQIGRHFEADLNDKVKQEDTCKS